MYKSFSDTLPSCKWEGNFLLTFLCSFIYVAINLARNVSTFALLIRPLDSSQPGGRQRPGTWNNKYFPILSLQSRHRQKFLKIILRNYIKQSWEDFKSIRTRELIKLLFIVKNLDNSTSRTPYVGKNSGISPVFFT